MLDGILEGLSKEDKDSLAAQRNEMNKDKKDNPDNNDDGDDIVKKAREKMF